MKTISIIGGTGKMGKPFKRMFQKEGCKVIIAGRKTKTSIEEAAKKGDVVIVAIPINNTEKIIKKIGKYVRKDALFTDFTSVKTMPIKAMLKYSKAEVIGGHPVFGPNVNFKGQTYVLCPARGKKHLKWFSKLLRKQGLDVIITTAKDHDRRMAIIQCLTHFTNISFANALKNFKIPINKTINISSPIYKLQMAVTGRILNQDAELYKDIQFYNPYAKDAIKTYKKSVEKLAKTVNKKNINLFKKQFNESSKFLGKYCKEAQKESDRLIRK